jgi:hypothetical protein
MFEAEQVSLGLAEMAYELGGLLVRAAHWMGVRLSWKNLQSPF